MPSMATVVIASVLISLAYLAPVAIASVVLAVRAGGRRDSRVDDHSALSESRFTIPVSVIVRLTASVRATAAGEAIGALLRLNYPELEVIVIAEDLEPMVWAALKSEWDLQAREFFYRQSLATAPVRMMYRSARDARLMIADKVSSSAADAWNCGVNLARFRYVSIVSPAVRFDADALLRAMAAAMRDPAAVVGATSHIEIAGEPTGELPLLDGPYAAFQHLASIRSIMESRLVWRRRRAGLRPRDAIVVWRREAIVSHRGFAVDAADPELDMMIRVQVPLRRTVESHRRPHEGRVVRTAQIFGRIAPRSFGAVIRLTAERQLAALQTLAMLLRSRARPPRVFGYFFASELLTPFVQAWAAVATLYAASAGWLPWRDFVLLLLLLSLGNASVGLAALLLRGAADDPPDEQRLTRLLLATPFEFLFAGGAAGYARVAGVFAFIFSAFRAR